VKPLGVHECALQAVFPIRKFYIAQIFLLVGMQWRNHVDTQLVKRFNCLRAIWNVVSAQECEILLLSWSDWNAHLST